jgi:hypothetical protein
MTAADRFLELQRRFLAGLQRRATDLMAMLDGSADPESLMRMFHSLVGIGGTYGVPQITDLSRPCEALCVSAMEQHRTFSFAERERLKHAVAEIASAPAQQEASRWAAAGGSENAPAAVAA